MTFWTQLRALKAVGMPPSKHGISGITGRQRVARAKRRKAARVARRITRRRDSTHTRRAGK